MENIINKINKAGMFELKTMLNQASMFDWDKSIVELIENRLASLNLNDALVTLGDDIDVE